MRAAVRIADRDGIPAVSMRNLARALGVKPMSLYFYVRKKDDLLGGMLDVVQQEVALPNGPDWKSALRRSAISMHDALTRHPWSASLFMSSLNAPAGLRYMEAVLKRLRGAGFTPGLTHHAYHVLDSHAIGTALWEAGYRASPDLTARAKDFARERAAEYPYIVEHAQQHFTRRERDEAPEFEFGLDLILDSLERLRRRSAAT